MSETGTSAQKTRPEGKSLLQVMRDFGVVVGFGGTVVAGYVWLESNYAKLDRLSAEKCALSYEIRLTRADIEFTGVDEEIDLHRNELEALLQATSAPEDHIAFKRGFIKSLVERADQISELKGCLARAKDGCFQGNHATDQCYD